MLGDRRDVRADRRPGEAQRDLNLGGGVHRCAVPGQDRIEAGAERVNQLHVERGDLRAGGAEAHFVISNGRDHDALVAQYCLLQALASRLNCRWSLLMSRYRLYLYEFVDFAPRTVPLSRHASSDASHDEFRIVARDLSGRLIQGELQSSHPPVYNVNYFAPKFDNMFYRQPSQNIGGSF